MFSKEITKDKIFTVVILCYNNQNLLYNCIDSVLNQTYKYIQIIIADDFSKNFITNEIAEYIYKNKDKNIIETIVFRNNRNLGTVKNINNALKLCKGKFIKLIAADDAFQNNNVLERMVNILQNEEDSIVLTDIQKCDYEMKPVSIIGKKQKIVNNCTNDYLLKKLSYGNFIEAPGVFFKNDFFEKNGLFDESFILLEDWPKWLEIIINGYRIKYVPLLTVKYRANNGVSTGINVKYLNDKERVFSHIIWKNRKRIGLISLIKSYIYIKMSNSIFIRKLYSIIYRRN